MRNDFYLEAARYSEAFAAAQASGSTERLRRLFARAGDRGNVGALRPLTGFLQHPCPEVAHAAEAAAGKLLDSLGRIVQDWPNIDRLLRTGGDSWHVDPAAVSKDWSTVWLILAACHSNGHARQKAVSLLGARSNLSPLPVLLLRLHDWVPAVRAEASQAFAACLDAYPDADFLRLRSLLGRLACSSRSGEEFRQRLDRRLGNEATDDQLLAALWEPADWWADSQWLRLVQTRPARSRDRLLREALSAPRFWVRRQAALQLMSEVDENELGALVDQLLAGNWSGLRCFALQTLVERAPARAQGVLIEHLTDRQAAVRNTARFYLQRDRQAFDIAAHYRSALSSSAVSRRVAALHGVRECGRTADLELVRPFLASLFSAERTAAVAALGALGGGRQFEELWTALSDPSSRVSRAAERALARSAREISAADLRKIIDGAGPSHAVWNALRLIQSVSLWPRLPLLLQAAASNDARRAAWARDALGTWIRDANKGFTRPSAIVLAESREALAGVSHRLDASLNSELSARLAAA